jgi:hypothetical protein
VLIGQLINNKIKIHLGVDCKSSTNLQEGESEKTNIFMGRDFILGHLLLILFSPYLFVFGVLLFV